MEPIHSSCSSHASSCRLSDQSRSILKPFGMQHAAKGFMRSSWSPCSLQVLSRSSSSLSLLCLHRINRHGADRFFKRLGMKLHAVFVVSVQSSSCAGFFFLVRSEGASSCPCCYRCWLSSISMMAILFICRSLSFITILIFLLSIFF